MPLIKSVSGFRGTIGGKPGDNLTPEDVVRDVAAYAHWLITSGAAAKVVIGRDGRPSGEVVKTLASATLRSMGIDVVDLDYATTPTVEMAVVEHTAGGGIILSASHNPEEWNALKLLNSKGEFLGADAGAKLLRIAKEADFEYVSVDRLGSLTPDANAIYHHIERILAHPLVETEAIRRAGYRVVLDAVNSVGAVSIPPLCRALGVECDVLNGEMTGRFAHNPEPLAKHLTELTDRVASGGYDLGIAVDPDVDRLALVGPGGRWIGEEYTLVTVADYVLSRHPGPVVSNLSSSRALNDIAAHHGQERHAARVGEVHVVAKMKEVGATIGGEGNGGIIDPRLHYGRDSLIGLALVLSHLATSGKSINKLRDGYVHYEMVKDRIKLTGGLDLPAALAELQAAYPNIPQTDIDGVKFDFPEGWVHLRASNTEPIIRIYAEAGNEIEAERLAGEVRARFESIIT